MPTSKKQTKLERAIIIRDQILAAGREHGDWEEIEGQGGLKFKVWKVASPLGWQAFVTTKFTGLPNTPKVDTYEAAVFVQHNPVPEVADMMVDLWEASGRKVLSIETHGLQHRLISMTPGPWEALFGLPKVSWPPSVQHRLAKAQTEARGTQASATSGNTKRKAS